MSNKVTVTVILILLAIAVTRLYDLNPTAHNFVVSFAHKVGINIGNYITSTPVCPVGWHCIAPTPNPTI